MKPPAIVAWRGTLTILLTKMPGVTKSLQSRAVQMAGMLGVDAVADRAAESLKADAERVRAAGNTDNGDQKGAPGAAAAAKSEEAK